MSGKDDDDPGLNMETFGRVFMGGASAKTARRRILEDKIEHYLDHGKILVRRSVAERWRDSRTIKPDLETIVVGAIARARKRAALRHENEVGQKTKTKS